LRKNWRFLLKTKLHKLCQNWNITLVFEKNANLFAENWQKSQKIVTITSTPSHPAPGRPFEKSYVCVEVSADGAVRDDVSEYSDVGYQQRGERHDSGGSDLKPQHAPSGLERKVGSSLARRRGIMVIAFAYRNKDHRFESRRV
jgi:hypothetical protein